jgi:hypothetical protein
MDLPTPNDEEPEKLSVNVELASPDQFVPALNGWRERCEYIGKWGQVEFFHYDFYGQAFSKIVRGHAVDISDVKALVSLRKVDLDILEKLFLEVLPSMNRYPALDMKTVTYQMKSFIEAERI